MLPQIAAVAILLFLLFLMLKERGMIDVELPEMPRLPGKKGDVKEKWFLPQKVVQRKGKETSPISGRCSFCGKKVVMPYKCKFCGEVFCDEHRLPEKHECEGVKALRRES